VIHKFVAFVGALLLSSIAMAQEVEAAIDVSAAVTSLTTDAVGAVTSIGTAVLTLAAVAVAFKWAKAAIFG
jgi:hypothetical protein